MSSNITSHHVARYVLASSHLCSGGQQHSKRHAQHRCDHAGALQHDAAVQIIGVLGLEALDLGHSNPAQAVREHLGRALRERILERRRLVLVVKDHVHGDHCLVRGRLLRHPHVRDVHLGDVSHAAPEHEVQDVRKVHRRDIRQRVLRGNDHNICGSLRDRRGLGHRDAALRELAVHLWHAAMSRGPAGLEVQGADGVVLHALEERIAAELFRPTQPAVLAPHFLDALALGNVAEKVGHVPRRRRLGRDEGNQVLDHHVGAADSRLEPVLPTRLGSNRLVQAVHRLGCQELEVLCVTFLVELVVLLEGLQRVGIVIRSVALINEDIHL
mmetsp:Transcript_2319/g.5776  ORF Transcript_2319/g.5776 Transcript_2319/m.5776 type:complete len:328 (-) Transcript_2319:2123-3106(-)